MNAAKLKLKPFTVVARCLCGCEENEIYFTRAANGVAAMEKVKQQVANPDPPLPQGGRDLDVLAVFRGHKHNQI